MKRPRTDAHVSANVDFEVVSKQTATLSIALPTSIIDNAQSPELRMYLAGQVARAAAIYRVSEIILFQDSTPPPPGDTSQFFETALRYAETPQYLRKHLFPRTAFLRHAGLLNPLALPHHHARGDFVRYREGVVIGRGTRPARYVDVGLDRLAEIDRPMPPGTRVTIDLEASGEDYSAAPGKYLYGKLCDSPPPSEYWGYSVRSVGPITEIFKDPQFNYDLVIGTSERGDPLGTVKPHKHVLIVSGGVQGLEYAAKYDPQLPNLGIEDPADIGELFDHYVNTCPKQGSRTIRTEEALLISLAALTPYLGIA